MRAKKSLGQHFLKSGKALKSIVEAAELNPGDTVLEIGPGQGALTEKLLASGLQLIAVEKDDELHEFLQGKFDEEISSGQLTLIHGDILDFEFENYKMKPAGYKLVANIPYNITGAILKKFLSAKCQPERMVLLVQKEVAERIVVRKQKPFDSAQGKESILSISVKAYGKPRYVEMVKAGSFVPMPRVDSAIIAIEGISRSFFRSFTEEEFFGVLRAGFSSKRKKLSSNLANLFPKGKVEQTFNQLGLDPNTRAEDVDVESWGEISAILNA